MADNIAITEGSGKSIAADDIGSVFFQRVKTTWGPDGTANDVDVATGKPLPIQIRSATGLIPFGEPTDAKSTATDTTSTTAISIWKQISASIQTLAAGVLSNGQTTMSGSLPVVLPSDQSSIPVTPSSVATSASVTFTPAASSHTAGDCNGAAGQFSSMGTSAGRILITSATLEIDNGTAEATAWRLYLYNVTPPSATADDGAWDLVSGDRASFLGYIDLGTAIDLGSTQWVETHGINKQIKLSGTGIFAYLINLTTLTPAANAHIVTLHAVGV